MASPTIPMGSISDGNKQSIVRFMGELDTIEGFEDLIINSNGNTLRLKDVADVVLTTEDVANIAYLNSSEAMAVIVSKSTDGSTIELNNAVFKTIKKIGTYNAYRTQRRVVLDSSIDINSSISNVSSSAVQGLILASIVLLYSWKVSAVQFWYQLHYPFAVIFTFAFLSLTGTSLNLISLMWLSIGVECLQTTLSLLKIIYLGI